MPDTVLQKVALSFYDLIWRVSIPALALNQRLAEGFQQRTLRQDIPSADLWIQAASAGEAHLTLLLLKALDPPCPIRVLVTSNTKQGLDILRAGVDETSVNQGRLHLSTVYFPFDRPTIMKKAISKIRPRVMVLIESEIWPGLLNSLKNYGCKTVVLNGRITEKSLARYLVWPSFWRSLAPDRILAISLDDGKRFGRLFGDDCVKVMSNMKFDRITNQSPDLGGTGALGKIVEPGTSLLVLGSIREEEESLLKRLVRNVLQRRPETVIGVFPRHMHRVEYWENTLDCLSVPWMLRSECREQVSPGGAILWDVFGELPHAYSLSTAAFVGGSLVPLGGQNFLEALTCGVSPVIGPSWENFHWVGQEIVEQGLVRVATDWKEASDLLVQDLKKPRSHGGVQEAVLQYVKSRQGGTHYACKVIEDLLRQ